MASMTHRGTGGDLVAVGDSERDHGARHGAGDLAVGVRVFVDPGVDERAKPQVPGPAVARGPEGVAVADDVPGLLVPVDRETQAGAVTGHAHLERLATLHGATI